MKLLGISGSLREGSHNGELLRAIEAALAPVARVDIFRDGSAIPLFNEDLEGAGLPSSISRLWSMVREADGLVFATPEYNQSIPGTLKNLIDWISRDPAGSPLVEKPVAVTGVTVGAWGARIAQHQLRTLLGTCGALVMPTPALYVANSAARALDLAEISRFSEAISRWTRRHGQPATAD